MCLNDGRRIELVDNVWRFDPIRNEWTRCQRMLTRRAFHISISLTAKKAHKSGANLQKKITPIVDEPVVDLIFIMYGLSQRSDQENRGITENMASNFSLKQCLAIEFYNLETDQWSRLKNTDSLLDHHMFQTIKNQNRLMLATRQSGSNNPPHQQGEEDQNDEDEMENNSLNLLNQLIRHQQAQSKLVISLRNLIYILKENCIHCYEFDLNLEQLICLPYFRLPANLSTFWLAAAVSSSTQPSNAKSLFTWYSEKETSSTLDYHRGFFKLFFSEIFNPRSLNWWVFKILKKKCLLLYWQFCE